MYNYNDDYLMHYGVKGMKWGVRRAKPQLAVSDTRKKFDSAKAAYKSAKKDYNKAYNKAHNYSARHPISQFVTKKGNAESNKRWDDAVEKAYKTTKAGQAYRQAKAERKQSIKDNYKQIDKQASKKDKFWYNDATRKNAAKYMTDHNMSMEAATKKANSEARRNTALILGAYGAVAVATMYKNR